MAECTCGFPCGGTEESCPSSPGYLNYIVKDTASKRESLLDEIGYHEDRELEALGEYGTKCRSCHELYKLKDVKEAYWVKYYVEPFGCTDGDYWASFNEIILLCSLCGDRNRYYKHRRLGEDDYLNTIHENYSNFLKLFKGRNYLAYLEDVDVGYNIEIDRGNSE
jgi:hypothetical protein